MAEEFFNLLREEHERITQLLAELSQASMDLRKRENLFSTLKIYLMPHIQAEESAFYRRLMEQPDTSADGVTGMKEHRNIEASLRELDNMPRRSPVWTSRLDDLASLIQRHIGNEETKVFTDTRRVFSLDEIEDMLTSFRKEENSIKTRMAEKIER